jgi:hypothetical protein
LARQSTAGDFAFSVAPVPRVIRAATPLDVAGRDDNAGVVARDPVQPAEQAFRLRRSTEQTEVVSEQNDRVERAERIVERVEGKQARVSHTASTTHLNRPWGVVDRDDILAARLEMEAHTARSSSDIEHAPFRVPHPAPMVRRPPAKRRQVQLRPHDAGANETVIALNHLDDILSVKRRNQQLPVRVASRLDNHLASIARDTAHEPTARIPA